MNPYPVSVLSNVCRSRKVLSMLADKWSILILWVLEQNGPLRYGQLQRTIQGISQKMLTQTLRELERNGLVSRKVYEVVPPQVEYQLTNLGQSLHESFAGMCHWAENNLEKVAEAQELYDLENAK